jgi:nifR3 family TIM-barrel protein
MKPRFFIGSIPVFQRVSLAPMDGISDQPFRMICKQMGAAISISEFINVVDVPAQLNDYLSRTQFSELERPFGLQIYGADLKKITMAAKMLEEKGPDFIDLNLGCSVRRIAGRGAGAGLLIAPQKVRRILQALVQSLSIPVTVKMRLGWDLVTSNYLELARMIAGEGAAMLSVHARRRDQSWREPADWAAIAEIKNEITIPVIGNGDIKCHADIERMLSETHCDGVMVGRAALGNPWLFSEVSKDSLSRERILTTVKRHWALMSAIFGRQEAAIRFKKHLKAYLNCPQFSNLDLSAVLRKNNPMAEVLAWE